MRLSLLVLLLYVASWAQSQPDPEYNILFNVEYKNQILNDLNASFLYFRSCDQKKARIKQSNHHKVVKLSSKDSRPVRSIKVLHQYLDCQQVVIKVIHNGFSMKVILHTKGIHDFNLWGTYYIYQPIEFEADKVVNIHFGYATPDEEMGEQALGYSGTHFWVHHFSKKAKEAGSKEKQNQFIDYHPLTGTWNLQRVDADSISPKQTIPITDFFIQSFEFKANNQCLVKQRVGGLLEPNRLQSIKHLQGAYQVGNGAIRIRFSNLGYTPRGGADYYQIAHLSNRKLQLIYNGGDKLGMVIATFYKEYK